MLLSKIEGTIFGGAIGDALGTLTENMDRKTVKKSYGGVVTTFLTPSADSVCPFLRRGAFSHETQMFLLALEMYAKSGRIDEEFYIEELIKWVDDEDNHRYPAGGHVNAALAYKSGADLDDARVKASEIDGAIPAVASGVFRWDNGEDAYQDGSHLVSLVYKDEILIDVGGLISVIVSNLMAGRVFLDTSDGKIEFIEYLKSFSQIETVRSYLDLVINTLKDDVDDIDKLILTFGNGDFVLESFSLAFYIFLKWGRDFRRTVITAVNAYGDFGGDTDAIAFLSGAFGGAYNGVESIPPEWIEAIESKEYLKLIAKKIFDKIKID